MKKIITMILIVVFAEAAFGQTSSSPQASNAEANRRELEKITVTGYIVPRIGDGPQPVETITSEQFKRQGNQTLQDVLQQLPQNVGNFTPFVNPGRNPSPGASSVNLRGLGDNATLVLIDSMRQVAFPFPQNRTESFTDLNSIPLAAVDRIEILNDGGSARYGSDAIAGVVNVILKDEYDGADLNFHYGVSQRGDYEIVRTSALGGISQELSQQSKFSVLAVFDYYEQGPIMQADRSYAHDFFPNRRGSYFITAPMTGGAGSFADPFGNIFQLRAGSTAQFPTPSDFYDPTNPANPIYTDLDLRNNQLVPREQRYGGYLKVNYQATNWLKFYEEFSDQQLKETVTLQAPPQLSPPDNVVIPATNIYNPFGEDLVPLGQVLKDFGSERLVTTVNTIRSLTGIQLFNLPQNWIVDASFLYAESDGTIDLGNAISRGKLSMALAGQLPGFVGQFYNPFIDETVARNPSALVDAIRATGTQDNRTKLMIWTLRSGGELVTLPSGPITVGFGLEYRSDNFNQAPTGSYKSGDLVAYGSGLALSANRYIRSAYGEFTIPILGDKWSWPGARALEIAFSERYDDYSDFGDAAKPKIAVRYKPFDDLTFRATYAEGFRAPSLTETFGGNLISFQQGLIDPQNPFLGPQAEEIRSQGNRALKPETSYGYFVGGVWAPGSSDPVHSWWGWANGFSVNFDWFQIVKRNEIKQLDAQTILNSESLFPGLVVRQPATGQIVYINDPFVNLGATLVDGFDLGVRYSSKEYSWGKVNLEFDGTYVYNYSVQLIHSSHTSLPGFGSISVRPSQVLAKEDSYTLPDLRATATLFYSKTLFGIDTFRTGITLNYVGSEHDALDNFKGTAPANPVQPNGLVHRVGSFTTLDWQIAYQFGKPSENPPQTTGYAKDGKRLVREPTAPVRGEGSSQGIRYWLSNTTFTFGINNIGDNRPPYSNVAFGYDAHSVNPIGRYFYIELDKKF
jgi:iron complex outermembrane recepter protein